MLIGSEKIGKTSLAAKFLFDYFPQVNTDFFIDRHSSKIIHFDKQNIEIKIIDMPSLVIKFNQNENSYINYKLFQADFHVFIIILIGKQQIQIQKIRKNIYNIIGYHCPCILVGNKVDKPAQRQVDIRLGKSLGYLWNCYFTEISAKETDQSQINQLFYRILNCYYQKKGTFTLKLESFIQCFKNFIERHGKKFNFCFQYLNISNTFLGLFMLFFGTIFTILNFQSEQDEYGTILFLFIMVGVSQTIISIISNGLNRLDFKQLVHRTIQSFSCAFSLLDNSDCFTLNSKCSHKTLKTGRN